MQQWANFPLEGTNTDPDMLQFLATKIIARDSRPMECFIDEAAIAGFESRGSGLKAAAVRSYLITLSRKTHCNIWLVTQLMSMVDKRSQWLADYYILCRAVHLPQTAPYPTYFEYVVYNEELKSAGEFRLNGGAARHYLYRMFDTDYIPFFDRLVALLREEMDIGEAEEAAYRIKTGLEIRN